MRNDKDQDLDRSLQEWASTHAPKQRDIDSIEQRILTRLLDKQSIDISPLATREMGSHPRRHVAILTAAAAALVFVSFVVHKIAVRDPLDRAIVATDSTPFAPALLTTTDTEHGKRLLTELQNVFDHRVVWISEDTKKVSFGVSPSSESTARARGAFVAIRVTLVAREAPSESWKLIDKIN